MYKKCANLVMIYRGIVVVLRRRVLRHLVANFCSKMALIEYRVRLLHLHPLQDSINMIVQFVILIYFFLPHF